MPPIFSRALKTAMLMAAITTTVQAQEGEAQSAARDSVEQARAIVAEFVRAGTESEPDEAATDARRDPRSQWTAPAVDVDGSLFAETDQTALVAKAAQDARPGDRAAAARPGTPATKAPKSPDLPTPHPPGRPRAAPGATINATAENVTAIANKGNAVAEIGVDVDSGRANVSAQNVVVIANGKDSRTSIGGCSGTVSADGIYNYGGTIDICSGGTKRDGKNCIEIYRSTCIVHRYIRPKKSPCLPGYWTQFRTCRLPADTRHAILDD